MRSGIAKLRMYGHTTIVPKINHTAVKFDHVVWLRTRLLEEKISLAWWTKLTRTPILIKF